MAAPFAKEYIEENRELCCLQQAVGPASSTSLSGMPRSIPRNGRQTARRRGSVQTAFMLAERHQKGGKKVNGRLMISWIFGGEAPRPHAVIPAAPRQVLEAIGQIWDHIAEDSLRRVPFATEAFGLAADSS